MELKDAIRIIQTEKRRNDHGVSLLRESTIYTEKLKEVCRDKRMIRCPSPSLGVFFATVLSGLAIFPDHYSVDAWGPQLSAYSPISPASPETQVTKPSFSKGEESRKGFLSHSLNSCLGLLLLSAEEATAAETVGKDPDCDDLTCLGVWDGLLAGESSKVFRKATAFGFVEVD